MVVCVWICVSGAVWGVFGARWRRFDDCEWGLAVDLAPFRRLVSRGLREGSGTEVGKAVPRFSEGWRNTGQSEVAPIADRGELLSAVGFVVFFGVV